MSIRVRLSMNSNILRYQCPEPRMSKPIFCTADPKFNSTCFKELLKEPDYCPDGTVCTAPYMPPIPAPPNYFFTRPERTLKKCSLGDWCSLGRSAPANDLEELKCPKNTFCKSPDVITPTICEEPTKERFGYCPPGSSKYSLCPAGHYCTAMDNSTKCKPSEYCPEGTYVPEACPAGYYCPNPAVKRLCPAKHFCPVSIITSYFYRN